MTTWLERLVQEQDVEGFLASAWGRSCMLTKADGLQDLMSLERFEELIASLPRASEGWLHLADGTLRTIPPEMVDSNGLLEMRKLWRAFQMGQTLYLTKAHLLYSKLGEVCLDVESALWSHGVRLREPVQAHVFLTPKGKRGFVTHRDEHASFILQLEGSKVWAVYEPRAGTAPHKTGEVAEQELGNSTIHEYRLVPGDVLFMPAWWPHEARTDDSYSMHVTLRIFPLRWRDVLSELIECSALLGEDVPLRLPDGVVTPRSLQRLSQAVELQPTNRLRSVTYTPKSAFPIYGLRHSVCLDQIISSTRLKRNTGIPCTVRPFSNGIGLFFPGGILNGPDTLRSVFDFVAETPELCADELPSIQDGHYDRVAFVKQLVNEGVLCIVRL
jgi:hypothetical protein